MSLEIGISEASALTRTFTHTKNFLSKVAHASHFTFMNQLDGVSSLFPIFLVANMTSVSRVPPRHADVDGRPVNCSYILEGSYKDFLIMSHGTPLIKYASLRIMIRKSKTRR